MNDTNAHDNDEKTTYPENESRTNEGKNHMVTMTDAQQKIYDGLSLKSQKIKESRYSGYTVTITYENRIQSFKVCKPNGGTWVALRTQDGDEPIVIANRKRDVLQGLKYWCVGYFAHSFKDLPKNEQMNELDMARAKNGLSKSDNESFTPDTANGANLHETPDTTIKPEFKVSPVQTTIAESLQGTYILGTRKLYAKSHKTRTMLSVELRHNPAKHTYTVIIARHNQGGTKYQINNMLVSLSLIGAWQYWKAYSNIRYTEKPQNNVYVNSTHHNERDHTSIPASEQKTQHGFKRHMARFDAVYSELGSNVPKLLKNALKPIVTQLSDYPIDDRKEFLKRFFTPLVEMLNSGKINNELIDNLSASEFSLGQDAINAFVLAVDLHKRTKVRPTVKTNWNQWRKSARTRKDSTARTQTSHRTFNSSGMVEMSEFSIKPFSL